MNSNIKYKGGSKSYEFKCTYVAISYLLISSNVFCSYWAFSIVSLSVYIAFVSL